MDNYQITRMTKNDVQLAMNWAAQEGWNPGLQDAECFYQTDPQGFFLGKLNNKIIAVGSAVLYDNHFAFCGCYIVDKSYRDQGYGLELTKARLAYIGSRNAGLDGVLTMCDKYQRLGYQYAHNNARYTTSHLIFSSKPHSNIIDCEQINFEQLCAYDKKHFPCNRPQFLHHWIKQTNALALGFVSENKVLGYGVIRACQNGYKIGPLFADNAEIAELVFKQLANYTKGKELFIDIPETNPAAVELTQRYKMSKIFATARMYLKSEPQLPINEIYGITSFELG